MERNLSVKFQKIIGSPVFPPGVFSGGGVFEREDNESRSHRGKLFALLSIVGPKNFDAVNASRIIFDCLEEEYFRDLEGSPLSALERASVSVNHRFIDLTLGSSAISGSTEFNLVIAVSWGQVLYISKVGSSAVYLLRSGVIREISMGDDAQVSTASGLVVEGDVLVLGTRGFKEYFPPEKLLSLLPEIEEEIGKLPGKSLVSALIIKFDFSESPSESEIVKFAEVKEPKASHFTSIKVFINKSLDSLRAFPVFHLPKVQFFNRPSNIFLRRRVAVHGKARSNGVVVLVFVIVALLFVGSVFYTLKKQNSLKISTESRKILSQVDLNISSATELVDLNNSRAKSLLEQSLQDLDKLKRLGYSSSTSDELYKKATELLSKVTKEKKVTPKLTYDLSLQGKGVDLSAIVSSTVINRDSPKYLFVSDAGNNTIYKITVAGGDVSIEKLNKGDLNTPKYLSLGPDRLLGVDGKGLFSISLKDYALKQGLISLQDLGEFKSFNSYLGNIYIISLKSSGIMRSLVLDKGAYSKPANWLKEDRDLSSVVSFAIDGSIYMLNKNGAIVKLEGGKSSDFNISGYDGTFSENSSIYTDSSVSMLYVFDATTLKIVVFNKDGVYQRRFDVNLDRKELPASLSPLFTVDEALNKAYFLGNSRLFQIDLE